MRSYVNWLIGLLAVILLPAATSSLLEAAQPKHTAIPFNGIPRDIDYIKNAEWTQVILQGNMPGDELVAYTKNDRIEQILVVALTLKSESVVNAEEDGNNPKRLTSVMLQAKNPAQEEGRVYSLSFDERDKKYRAVVYTQGQMVNVWTDSGRMQSILETAMRDSLAVMEFTYDSASKEITRGKLNINLQNRNLPKGK